MAGWRTDGHDQSKQLEETPMAQSVVKNQEILLKAGTNELEIITLFLRWSEPGSDKIIQTAYGINAAKVRELVAMPEAVTEVPDSPACVLGVFLLRGHTIPLIDLCAWFKYAPDRSAEALEKWVVIVTEINGKPFGFISHGVDKVYRVSWQQIQPPPALIAASSSLTGVCLVDGQIIQMVDFESITAAIDPSMAMKTRGAADKTAITAEHRAKQVVVADDSRVIQHQVRAALEAAGYQVVVHADGQAAWDYLESLREKGAIDDTVLAVVSDIEMPRMDGHHLCMRIKNEKAYQYIPVLLFSSLISKALFHKGEEVRADDQITKPELGQLVDRLRACVQLAEKRRTAS
jgi:two-component system chemotaxis response regulator CheV